MAQANLKAFVPDCHRVGGGFGSESWWGVIPVPAKRCEQPRPPTERHEAPARGQWCAARRTTRWASADRAASAGEGVPRSSPSGLTTIARTSMPSVEQHKQK